MVQLTASYIDELKNITAISVSMPDSFDLESMHVVYDIT